MSPRILIVEDDAILAAHLEETLGQLGYESAGMAATGQAAIDLALARLPDAILMDIRLRGEMTGTEAAEIIHKQADIPIIYVTAYSEEMLLQQAKGTDAYAYLVKPVRDHELRASLEMALYKHASETQVKHLTQVLRAVRSVNQLITREHNSAQLIQEACDILMETRGYLFVWVGREGIGDTAIYPVAQAGTCANYLAEMELSWRQGEKSADPVLTALGTHEPSVCRSLRDVATGDPWSQRGLICGFLSAASVPMMYGERLFGVLSVYASSIDFFSDEEVGLLMEVAGDLAFGLRSLEEESAHKRADEAQATSERRFRGLFENSVVGIFETDRAGRLLVCNVAYARMFGYDSPAKMVDEVTSVGRQLYAHAEQRQEVVDILAAHGTLNGREYEVRRRDGSLFWVSLTASAVKGSAGELLYYQGTNVDITVQKHSEAALRRRADEFAALFESAHDLAEQHDVTALLNTTVDRAITLLAAQAGFLYLYDQDHDDLEMVISRRAALVVGARVKLGEGISGRVAAAKKPLIVENYSTWEGRSPQVQMNSASVIAAPMLHGGELMGVLGVNENVELGRRYDEADLVLLSLFAGQAASAVHNARLLEHEQRSRSVLSSLYDLSRQLADTDESATIMAFLAQSAVDILHVAFASISVVDGDDLVVKSAYPMHFFEHDVQIGRHEPLAEHPLVREFMQGDEPIILLAGDPRLTKGERMTLFPGTVGRVGIVPLRVQGQEVGIFEFSELIDSTEKMTEDRVRLARGIGHQAASAIRRASFHEMVTRQVGRLAALHEIDSAISSSFDFGVTAGILLRQAMHELEVDAAAIMLLNPHLQTMEYVASQGFRHPLGNQQARLGSGYAGMAALERHAITIPDLMKDPAASQPGGTQAQALTAREGFAFYHVEPLVAKGAVKGVLELFVRAPLVPGQEWLAFAATVAAEAAIAIDNTRLFEDLQRSNAELAMAYDATLEGWSRALDLRDHDTEGHTQRVASMAESLSMALGMSVEAVVQVRRGALLHDIGKMGIPDNILLKAGPLSEAEWVIMRQHPQLAYDLLYPISYLRRAIDIPYCHHEKWDGSGYPRHLQREEIPLAGRVFAVVDVWDALTSDRPYRPAWSYDKATAYLVEEKGKHFDPAVVDMFIRIHERD